MAPNDPTHEIDLQLMQAVSRNDQAAIARLYDRFGSLVYRMAYQAMPNRTDTEDAMQEVFIRLWKTAGRYDPERAALVTWVMLITRRYLVDRLRRTKSSIRASSLEEKQHASGEGRAMSAGMDVSPEEGRESMERDERFAALMKHVEQLPELQRTVVTRAYLGGQTLRQIGEELDTPLGTIKSALSRALVRLRERGLNEGLAP
ncbi:MAG: sigma-70 family RNA polymerase sigma factor [Phycisphaerae bacterium]|nr:sigma-70 family RNA polymerase sigma factor [Phycisphaerae bacterium]